jgi:hypothetical protein
VCDVKRRGLTETPAENAPDAPTMENYGKYDKVVPGLWKQVYQTDDNA